MALEGSPIEPDPISMVVGDRLRELRTMQGWTVSELASRAGLSKGMVSKIENGRTSASLSTLSRLAAAIRVPMSALFRGLDEVHEVVLVRAGAGQLIRREVLPTGLTQHQLGLMRGDQQQLEPTLITITEPIEYFPVYEHPGAEFLYMLDGSMEYGYGEDRFELHPGDSFQFIGEVGHGPVRLLELPVRYLAIKVLDSVRPNRSRRVDPNAVSPNAVSPNAVSPETVSPSLTELI